MMGLALVAFIAGVLSVLAPCVLPVLPVILGGSLTSQQWYKPLLIVGSTVISIVIFTIILKASTLLLGVDPAVWTRLSGLIIVLYGLTLFLPHQWDKLRTGLGLDRVNQLLTVSDRYPGVWSDILLGASLGPIFASCSPTYALLLGVIFPQSFGLGVLYTLIYGIGFGSLLLMIAYGGRAVIGHLQRLTDPNGRFKKSLGLLLIVTGILIITGWMKELESTVLNAGRGDITIIEEKLLDTFVQDDTIAP